MSLADQFDGFLVDLDGVVWIGREPVPGSVETLRELLDAGKRVVFVTNNPGRLPATYAERLRELGIEVGEERIVTAGIVAARLAGEAAGPGAAAFVIGAEPLREMVAAAGPRVLGAAEAEGAAVVVVSGHRGFDYAELRAAKRALDAGAGLIATSRDPTMPYPGGELPGTGAVLAAVEVASGRRATIAGKPERHLFELAVERAGGGELAMVGDRLSSDVEGGRGAGLETVLVLSGTTSGEEAAGADPGPDHVLDDLAGLLR
ncbi:MAG TPA: HAD-IIA family hydrolase [Solirubrobacterales bacterium]|nr:HAD-IIA family hydrolase [Solirubrobacterales bacterium]